MVHDDYVNIQVIHTQCVAKKLMPLACYNFDKHEPISTIFVAKMLLR